jgi:hypothetical protein
MKRDIGKYLRKNIPEFQQNSPTLNNYLDAVGEFLDDTKDCIEGFDNSHNDRGTITEVNKALFSYGYTLPKGLNSSIRRKILRDAHEIIRKTGTIDGLILSLRLIGADAEIREGWIPYPELVAKGMYKNPFTGVISRLDIDSSIYNKLLYGDVYETPEGVFFRGYEYSDLDRENVIENVVVVGETYKNTPTDLTMTVSKTPYVVVRFPEDGLGVSSSFDAFSSDEYELSIREQITLLNEIVSYFISSGNRPTTVRVLVIASTQNIDEDLSITDLFQDEHAADLITENEIDIVTELTENNLTIEYRTEYYTPDGGDDLEDVFVIEDDQFDQEEYATDLNQQFEDDVPEITEDEFNLLVKNEQPIQDVSVDSSDVSSEIEVMSKLVSMSPNIGTDILIGVPQSTFVSQFSAFSVPEIGEVIVFDVEEEEWAEFEFILPVFLGETPIIPLRAGTLLRFTNPHVSIKIFGGNKDKNGSYQEVEIQTINSGSFIDYIHPSEYRYVRLQPLDPSNTGTLVSVFVKFYER